MCSIIDIEDINKSSINTDNLINNFTNELYKRCKNETDVKNINKEFSNIRKIYKTNPSKNQLRNAFYKNHSADKNISTRLKDI